MRRVATGLITILLLGACASGPRPPVVPRNAGTIDGDRSISTMSDREWKVQQEPAEDGGDDSGF